MMLTDQYAVALSTMRSPVVTVPLHSSRRIMVVKLTGSQVQMAGYYET
jgi:hypothetical protein